MAGNCRRLLPFIGIALVLLFGGTHERKTIRCTITEKVPNSILAKDVMHSPLAAEEVSTVKDIDPSKGPNKSRRAAEPFHERLLMLKNHGVQEHLHQINSSSPLQPEFDEDIPGSEWEERVKEDDSPTGRPSKMIYQLYDLLHERRKAIPSLDPNVNAVPDPDTNRMVEVDMKQVEKEELLRNHERQKQDVAMILAATKRISENSDNLVLCKTEGHTRYYCFIGDSCCKDNENCCTVTSHSSDWSVYQWRDMTIITFMRFCVTLVLLVMTLMIIKRQCMKTSGKKDEKKSVIRGKVLPPNYKLHI